ncbi:MAG: DJ-1/PfpI family protein [Candidatus Pacebacteria bacterium]|nr:DJ-1/PfpI family protein [Candidatus Paceibacterota bacterium]
MKNWSLFLVIIVIILGVGIFLFFQFQKGQGSIIKENSMPESLNENSKKVVILVAFRDFRDEEYFVPKEILENNGVKVVTASTKEGVAIGADGGEANVDLTINKLNVEDYDAIIFVGGPGALEYLDNEDSYKVANDAVDQNKILAAICIAPTILAKAGLLEGKKATVWSSPLDKSAINTLKENGAEFVDNPVVQDGNIITANGPEAAKEFGEKILENLNLL